MKTFFEMLQQVFRNHVKYRCLMLSFVHIMQQNPIIAKRYGKIQATRNETWVKNIQALKEGKYISANTHEVDFLVSTIALIARFWISEATVSFKDQSEESTTTSLHQDDCPNLSAVCHGKGKAGFAGVAEGMINLDFF